MGISVSLHLTIWAQDAEVSGWSRPDFPTPQTPQTLRTPKRTEHRTAPKSSELHFRYFFDTFSILLNLGCFWYFRHLSASLGFGPTIRSIPSHLQAAFPALACAEQNPSPCDCKWTLRSVLATDLCSWLSTSPCSSLCHYAFDRDSTLA